MDSFFFSLTVKRNKTSENTNYNFPETKVSSSNSLFAWRHSIQNNIKQTKAAKPHIKKAGTRKRLAIKRWVKTDQVWTIITPATS